MIARMRRRRLFRPSSCATITGGWALLLLIACGGGGPSTSDGQDDAPGSGLVFVVNSVGVAERTRGFDLDGACVATDDCVDNRLYQLRAGNTEVLRVLSESADRLLVEIAGIEPEPAPEVDLVSVSLYVGEPTPTGGLRISERSLLEGRARSRALAQLENDEISAPPGHELELVLGTDRDGASYDLAFRLAVAALQARIDPAKARLDRFLIGGAATIPDLATRPNPFCGREEALCGRDDQTLLDLIASAAQPDIDISPADGLEKLHVNQVSRRVSRCLDGQGRELEPSNAAEPWTCALRSELKDGYSITFELEAHRFEGEIE